MPLDINEHQERENSIVTGLLNDLHHQPFKFIQDFRDLQKQILEIEDSLFRLTDLILEFHMKKKSRRKKK